MEKSRKCGVESGFVFMGLNQGTSWPLPDPLSSGFSALLLTIPAPSNSKMSWEKGLSSRV